MFRFQFVCISFWTLYSYNRELVYPKSLDGVIPLWLNHAMVSKKRPCRLQRRDFAVRVPPLRRVPSQKGLTAASSFSSPPSPSSEPAAELCAAGRCVCLQSPREAFSHPSGVSELVLVKPLKSVRCCVVSHGGKEGKSQLL